MSVCVRLFPEYGLHLTALRNLISINCKIVIGAYRKQANHNSFTLRPIFEFQRIADIRNKFVIHQKRRIIQIQIMQNGLNLVTSCT